MKSRFVRALVVILTLMSSKAMANGRAEMLEMDLFDFSLEYETLLKKEAPFADPEIYKSNIGSSTKYLLNKPEEVYETVRFLGAGFDDCGVQTLKQLLLKAPLNLEDCITEGNLNQSPNFNSLRAALVPFGLRVGMNDAELRAWAERQPLTQFVPFVAMKPEYTATGLYVGQLNTLLVSSQRYKVEHRDDRNDGSHYIRGEAYFPVEIPVYLRVPGIVRSHGLWGSNELPGGQDKIVGVLHKIFEHESVESLPLINTSLVSADNLKKFGIEGGKLPEAEQKVMTPIKRRQIGDFVYLPNGLYGLPAEIWHELEYAGLFPNRLALLYGPSNIARLLGNSTQMSADHVRQVINFKKQKKCYDLFREAELFPIPRK